MNQINRGVMGNSRLSAYEPGIKKAGDKYIFSDYVRAVPRKIKKRDLDMTKLLNFLYTESFPRPIKHSVSRVSTRHYFNDIHFTSLPFYLGSSCFVLFFYVIVFLKKFATITPVYLMCALIILLSFMVNWFDDLISESRLNGRYNRKIRSSLVCGFVCFLISEVLLFGGFF